MCECDCLSHWLSLSAKVKEIELQLDKVIKKETMISLNEFNVLYYLSQEPQKSMRIYDLQEKVGLTQSAMSRLVVRLEQTELDYIKRKKCPKDKRGVCIVLTEKGNQMVEDNIYLIEQVIENYQSFLSYFPKDL